MSNAFRPSIRTSSLSRTIALLSTTVATALAFALAPASAAAQAYPAIASLHAPAQANRVAAAPNFASQTQLSGHIPGWIVPSRETTTVVDLSHSMHLSIVLARDPAVEAAFDQLLAAQQDPASPYYHQWLTPQQVGSLYGPTASDLAAVTNWLIAQGLTVQSIAPSRVILEVSGSIANVASAFHTSFGYFTYNSEPHLSAISEPSIPTALVTVVKAIDGLTQLPLQSYAHVTPEKQPAAGPSSSSSPAGLQPDLSLTNGEHFMAPKDFDLIYDLAATQAGGNTGATIGTAVQKVAIIGRSRINATDISEFETNTGLPSVQPTVVIPVNGVDPGTPNSGDTGEATLDVQRVISTAPGAEPDLVVSGTPTTGALAGADGVYVAAAWNVNTLKDPIMTISFGACERAAGASGVSVYNTLFQAAAAEGISVFVSAGDSAAAGCDTAFTTAPSIQYLSPNYICSSTYVTCVGGTEFNDTANPSQYWSSSNAAGYLSVLSYIPEGAWNEPDVSNSSGTLTGYQVGGGGGGVSSYVTKPSWQTGTGVPADGYRDTPDVAFSAAGHDGYYGCLDSETEPTGTCLTGYFVAFSGTSAAAPGMAGIAALLNTKLGAAQGNLNPLLYKLAASSPTAFHDVTVATSGVTGCTTASPSLCNNSTPSPTALTGGLAGYAVTAGYDQATGLGSLDVGNFIAAAGTSLVATTLVVAASPSPAASNQAVTLTATLTPGTSTHTPTGTVQFYSNGSAIGSAATLAANAASISYTFPSAGSDTVTATYSGDANFATSTAAGIPLVVNASSFTVTPASTTYNLISGATTGNTDAITVTSVGSFAGNIALACTVTPADITKTAAGTCSIAPNSATLTSGSTSPATLTIATPPGTAGALNVVVTGTGGGVTINSATITVNLTAASFTMSANPASGTLISGASTGSTVTLTSINGFAGPVNITCTAAGQAPATAAGSCAASPTPVTLTAGGTATSTVTITTTPGTSGALTATIGGIGTTAGATLTTTASTTDVVTLTASSFTLAAPSPATLSLISGATTGNTATVLVSSVNNFAGTVTLSCAVANTSGTAAGTCSATPVTLTAGGTGTSTITLSSTLGSSGGLTLTITGTGTTTGAMIATMASAPSKVTVTLTGAAFTLTPTAGTLSPFTSGATTGNTEPINLASTNGFAGTVSFTCAMTPTIGSPTAPATCSATSVTLTSGGTATATVTITSTTAHLSKPAGAHASLSWRAGGGAMLAMLFCLLPIGRRRRAFRSLAVLGLLALGIASLSGCGGGGSSATPPVQTSAGTYTVTVTGSGTTAGSTIAATATTTFTATIN